MPDPLMINGLQTGQVAGPMRPTTPAGPTTTADGLSFKDMLLNSLNEVNRLQQEAAAGVDQLMTGQTDDVAGVFSAVRKADIAFSMLMEMRNKMIEAYQELQQMRV
ncbi:MAG TPA: flagellar hook-basal body complex protein FliE [Phycisphaerae bacterium]|nr:flagellar hook-basal body complex protein FliE [Phycisphaerae bacterium]HOJ74289.1 flagellar hook-basal body complex protein FliE [Phycisphaerae bacterium]HOM51368.1 flagellar hook-basal body complex protein FliE [Phycisphaerae bacterium]HON68351.1 flagellar hook-basal body complex protein FliE [Phycisphaerae bacterium]HOQ85001.1 flagellar hook-basal body complex protein FliE [Phycisphaerae bacterium]